MFLIDKILLLGAALIFVGVVSSKLAYRIGVPTLVLFILIGMLAGTEGIGGIDFAAYDIAHAVGTISLAVILFDGGLRTSFSSIRAVWKPAGILATVGVIITAVITGAAAVWWLDLPWYVGLLLGSTVSSTDAAAVFANLKSQGVGLDDRLSSTLEIESGANDPMAIFLTVGFIELITTEGANLWALSGIFFSQMVIGAIGGIALGYLSTAVINRIKLDAAGLYPVLVLVMGIITYGIVVFFKGSGFLAIYLCGIVIGNREVVFKRGIFLFADGIAWTGQIVMFTIMGLLTLPSSLIGVAGDGIMIALALTFIARPVAVFLLVPLMGFNLRELIFLSWVGLKGAVPIILAIFPFLYDVHEAPLIFDVVFFVVLISATTQGWSMAWVARKLGLDRPKESDPPAMLEITSLVKTEAQIVDFVVEKGVPALGKNLRELPFPQGVIVAMITRDGHVRSPQASTVLLENDHVFIVVNHITLPLVERIFTADFDPQPPLSEYEGVYLDPGITAGDVARYYAIDLPCAEEDETLAEFLMQKLNQPLQVGQSVDCGANIMTLAELEHDQISSVGLRRRPDAAK